MLVTALGHATALVEVDRANILVDPVLGDELGEGLLVPCPARTLDLARLPRIDLVTLTSIHHDHVDFASLARLPRDCRIVCPRSPTLEYALGRLGFTRVLAVAPNTRVKIGRSEILTTLSVRSPTELGIVIKDPSGIFWHQGDSVPSPENIDHLRRTVGNIDLLFAAYAVQSFAYYGSQRARYPTQYLHGAATCAERIAPRLVVPASAGFRYRAPMDWVNSFVFPISRERYLDELARVAPGLKRDIGNPGDVFEIRAGAVLRKPGASPIVTSMTDDTHRIAFDPTSFVPPSADPNLDGYPEDELRRDVEALFDELSAFVREGYDGTDAALREYRRIRTTYGLGVVFPDGAHRSITIDFAGATPKITRSEGGPRDALVTHRLPASVIVARSRYERRYDFSGGLMRLSIISPASYVDGKVVIEANEPTDLTLHMIEVRPPGPEQNGFRHMDYAVSSIAGSSNTATGAQP